ncbi:baseplate multidomain protein megatron [Phyllobacterium endophyticum]|uniref:baseplate multidomain protein megatron n=1 Tax=Phyllobacterium endophyticum TaxID=1149773 RepID=UPI0011C742F5|nr:glycoside hydrolase/phage tail family protein [Phyllobacterium endophyticum]TXR49873.1 host specificity protein [Phyllobacterium endophyticum]
MATLVLTAAVGALTTSGTVAAAIGSAVASVGGYLIDQALFGRTIEGARMSSMRPMSAEEGAALPRVYGSVRISGTLIWATRFEEAKTTSRQGGKGRQKVTEYNYFANLAIAVAEGQISMIRRIWVDGKELDQTRCTIRVFSGTTSQPIDPLIEAKQGQGNAPAYRDTAYVVFDRFPLDDYGNRIPQFQFEVVRSVNSVARDLKAVALVPGATEFGLSPHLVTSEPSKGKTKGLNRNCLRGATDWNASMYELQRLCPSLEHVAIVVPWFGADLRAAECAIKPGVMDRAGHRESSTWRAGGVSRLQAHLISRADKGAAYGGTPSDESVIDAILDAKARGLSITLYPFIMMDIRSDNNLPDPYGGPSQGAYPWRGRITCHPAPYRPGSPNTTAAASAEVATFLGTAKSRDFETRNNRVRFSGNRDDWGYRRFMLHLAHLALCAGGVDTFIVGSELFGLTMVRDQTNGFPFVDGLCELAGDLRHVLGPGCKLTYGADWTEYFGHHPQDGSGDVFFHLDPLWAHPAIDAIGIDNYMPLSDWRDGDYSVPNPDDFNSPYDLSGLQSQIASGEGFDWCYRSVLDRTLRTRTPITDGAGKAWVYRYKDLNSWWSNRHHNRQGGVESAVPTAWQPRGKPIWLTELGCPAADKGPNQPNVFPDMKSSEGAYPYFSDHGRSDLAQNRFLRAHFNHWKTANADGMIDPDRIYAWAWDTRPYPEFPLNRTLWSDGNNWMTGHWLNGRLSGVPLDELLEAILGDFGAAQIDTGRVDGFVSGYVIEEPTSARAAIEPLLALYGVDSFESGNSLAFRSAVHMEVKAPLIEEFVEQEDNGPVVWRMQELAEQPARIEMAYRDPMLDYQAAMTFAERLDGRGTESIGLPGMIDNAQAKSLVEEALQTRRAMRRTASFEVPWKQIALKPGDRVRISGNTSAPDFVVTSIEDGLTRRVEARALPQQIRYPVRGVLPSPPYGGRLSVRGRPHFELLDLPMWPGVEKPSDQFRIAAFADPWGGTSIYASPEATDFKQRTLVPHRAVMGELAAPLAAGPSGRVLKAQSLTVRLYDGELSSASLSQVLNGANSALLAAPEGSWEVLQFLDAEEVESDVWRLSGLLRGQCGTEREATQSRPSGTPFVLINNAVSPAGLKPEETGLDLTWRIGASGEDFTDQYFSTVKRAGGLRALQPLEPVHIRSQTKANGEIHISWVRRGRIDADSWFAPDLPLSEERELYRVEIRKDEKLVRSLEVEKPYWTYGLAQRQSDHGGLTSEIDFSVAMISAIVGPGRAARRKLPID